MIGSICAVAIIVVDVLSSACSSWGCLLVAKGDGVCAKTVSICCRLALVIGCSSCAAKADEPQDQPNQLPKKPVAAVCLVLAIGSVVVRASELDEDEFVCIARREWDGELKLN